MPPHRCGEPPRRRTKANHIRRRGLSALEFVACAQHIPIRPTESSSQLPHLPGVVRATGCPAGAPSVNQSGQYEGKFTRAASPGLYIAAMVTTGGLRPMKSFMSLAFLLGGLMSAIPAFAE